MEETAQTIQPTPEWARLLSAITARPGDGRIGVLGPTGSGKSTLAAWLGQALADRGPTGRLDADPGQGTIGPPATVALGREPDPEGRPEVMCFVGAVSPDQHLLAMLAGVARLARRADRVGFDWLVVDPTGFLDYPSGHDLHYRLIETLELDHLVVVDGATLSPVLSPLQRRHRPEVHELRPSPHVVQRSRAERRDYRADRFRRALKDARPRVIPARIPIHGHDPGRDSRSGADPDNPWAGLLVGLLDRSGFLITLGVAREKALAGLSVLVPPVDFDAVASVEVGTDRVGHHVRNLHA